MEFCTGMPKSSMKAHKCEYCAKEFGRNGDMKKHQYPKLKKTCRINEFENENVSK